MNNCFLYLSGILLVGLLNGCATVTGSTDQNVLIETTDKSGKIISDANCHLSNDKGSWAVTTPGTTSIRKSGKDLHIICKKAGYQQSTKAEKSKANAGMWGNIIVGGGIGAIIDHNKGTAYNYPSNIKIAMEKE